MQRVKVLRWKRKTLSDHKAKEDVLFIRREGKEGEERARDGDLQEET